MKNVTLLLIGIVGVCAAQNQQRIITAGSAMTEIVCALGDCDKIVGSDRTSLYPAEIQKLPSIGYRSGINAEGILSLKPTMVIVEKDYVELAVLQQLAGTSVKVITVDRELSLDGTRKAITQIAVGLNRGEEGKKLIASIERDIDEAKSMLAKAKSTPKVACIFNRGSSTVSVGGKGTFAEILEFVGAKNAFNGIEGYKPLSTEALISVDPEYVLMVTSGFESLGGMEGVLKLPGIALTTAGKKKQIIAMESLKLTNFGPRLGEAVKELVVKLHPELATK